MPPACSPMPGRGLAALVFCAVPIAVGAQTTIHLPDRDNLAIAILSANPGDTIVLGNDIVVGSGTAVAIDLAGDSSRFAFFDTASGIDPAGFTAGAMNVTAGLLVPSSLHGDGAIAGNGTLSIADDDAVGGHGTGVTLGNASSVGTLAITTDGAFSSSRTFTLGVAGGIISTSGATSAELGGVVRGTGSLTKAGAGTLILSGANSYTGSTTVTAGTLVTANATALGPAPALTVGSSGTIDLHGYNLSLTTLAGRGNVLLNGAATLTIGSGGSDSTFDGTIGGTGSVAKAGAGTLFLRGSNTYSGGTSIGAGTVSISSDANLGSSPSVTMATGSTLAMTASGTYTKDVTLGRTSTFAVAPGQTATWMGSIHNPLVGPGSITPVGTLVVSGGGTLVLGETGSSYSGGTVVTGNSTVRIASDTGLGAPAGDLTLGEGSSSGTLAITTEGTFSSVRPVTLGAAGGTVNISPGSYAVLTGTVSGPGGLTKTGSGVLALTGSNTYAGATTISDGTLSVSSDRNLGSSGGGVTLGSPSSSATLAITTSAGFASFRTFTLAAGGGTIDTADGTAATLTGAVVGTGGLVKEGAGSLTLSGANTYAGATSVEAGTLFAGASNVFGSSPSLSIASSATVDFGGFSQSINTIAGTGTVLLSGGATMVLGGSNADSVFSGTIAGSGGITKSGLGTLTLSAPNTFTGGITVAAGTLSVGADSHLGGAGPVALGDATTLALTSAGTFAHDLRLAGQPLIDIGTSAVTWTGLVTDGGSSGALHLARGGTLTLSNSANSYSGGTVIDGGAKVIVGADGALGGARGGLTLGDSTSPATLVIDAPAPFQSSRPIAVGPFGGLIETAGASTVTWSGAITGAGGVTKSGTGSLTLGGANTYSGATAVTAGTLRAGRQDAFGASGVVRVADGATVDLAGFSQSLRSLSGGGTVALGGAAVLTLDIGASNLLFGGTLTGSGALVKNGSGTLALTGANSYTGGTTVSGGTLAGNTTSLQGDIVNNARVIFDQAASGTYAGSMTGTGLLEKSGAGTLTLAGANSYGGGTLLSAGTIVGDPSSLQGTIVDHGSLIFDHEAPGSFDGTILGTGSVQKHGGGTLSIGGAHPFTGTMLIHDGTVALNAGLGGHVTVAPGASLRGAGWLGGSLEVAGALFVPAPGSAAASFNAQRLNLAATEAAAAPSLVIGGNLTATPGSLLDFTVAPNGAPPIVVNGLASLTGTRVNVDIADPSPARYATYVGLTSAGLTADGVVASSTTPGVVPVLKHGPRQLFVTLLNENIPLGGIATSPNAVRVGGALDRLKAGMGGDLAFVVRELTGLDDLSLNDALKRLSGELHSTELRLTADESVLVTDLVRAAIDDRDHEDDEKRQLTGAQSLRWWFQFTGQHSRFAPFRFESAIADTGGAEGGFDFRPYKRIILGGGGSFSRGALSMLGLGGSSDLHAPRAFGYAGYNAGPFVFNGGGSTSRTTYVTRRPIAFAATVPTTDGEEPLSGGIDRVADSEQTGVTHDAWTEWKDTLKYGSWTYDCKIGYRAATYERDPFNEIKAGAISLTGLAQVLKTKEADATIHLFRRRGTWRPRVFVSYRRQLGDLETSSPVQIGETPAGQFVVNGVPLPQDEFHGIFGVTKRSMVGVEYTLEYEMRQAANEKHHGVHFRIRFR